MKETIDLAIVFISLFLTLLFITLVKLKYISEFYYKLIDDVMDFEIDEDFDDKMEIAESILEKYTFTQLFFMLKPLEYKYLYTDEELDFILNA